MPNERETLSEWFYLYSQDVFNFLVYYSGTLDVEDLVQEVFIKAAKGLDSYQSQASPKTWLFSIARNLAIDKGRRKETKMSRSNQPFEESTSNRKTGESPEQILIGHEEKQELYRVINQQKKKYRDVLILRGIQGLTVSETAQILGWKETAVRTNYHRAIKALQNEPNWRESYEG
ncbi:RNA polymerase sigma factor [Chryseomicrobium palamuruense]|uniref:RNA polymerase sigma factor n=1 Tax=Chryseomicrobium palamuruense TaxID=682973 RepID=A0ABV8UYM6_9BACL